MRPPEFTGGNANTWAHSEAIRYASMRPPEFTGGNVRPVDPTGMSLQGFNEAAGIHRRKQTASVFGANPFFGSFNEAAGIHRRKRLNTPDCIIKRIPLQ